jgi:hypothetical protein
MNHVCAICYAHWRIGDALWLLDGEGRWLCPECFKETLVARRHA